MFPRLSPPSCARCSLSTSSTRSSLSLRPSPPIPHSPFHPRLYASSAAACKGKAKALDGLVGVRWSSGARRPRSLLEVDTRAATAAAWQADRLVRVGGARNSSSNPQPPPVEPPIYAHEDLLSPSSTNPPRSPSASRSSRSSPSRPSLSKPQAFFSPSYLLAEEPPLPPPSTSPLVPLSTPIPSALPSSVLSNGLPNPEIRWRARPQTSIADDVDTYKALGKFKLSSLVVLTTMAGYAMCPVDLSTTHAAMDAFAQSLSSSLPADTSLSSLATSALGSSPANNLTLSVLLPTTVGTTLCAFSAASFNQLIEAPYDAQMARTRSRPLPKRTVTPLHAASYGFLTGALGLSTLYMINPLSAFLGLFTIVLYCPLYTISKRHSVYNTWLGSVVGAIPPLIGWAACTDSLDPMTQPGAWALFALMFFWQFPHFMSLAHTLRSSYASSGYRMLSVVDPPKNALVSLRYSLALLPLCAAFPALGLTTPAFAWLSVVPNGVMAAAAWRFWRKREERRAKELFWASLVQLPAVLVLMLACKKGLWEGTGKDDREEEQEGAVKEEQLVQVEA